MIVKDNQTINFFPTVVDTGGKFYFLSFILFYFPRYRPPFGECLYDLYLFSISRYELCVCVWELVYVCAYEHKFGVATNHGKF